MNNEITVEEVFHAYFDCRKNKRNKSSVIKFEENLEKNLIDLYLDLKNNKYKIGRSIYFILKRPKYREVWAANFRDRIVHHIVYNRISDYYFKRFIFDSYACIPKKGVHATSNRIRKYIKNSKYYTKLDVRNFFVSIDKEILLNILTNSNIIKNDLILKELIVTIVNTSPTTNYFYRGDLNLIQKVPIHKSLFKKSTGLPIGNLTSQLFANIYLHEFDRYIKFDLKIKKYIRYVDDVIFFSNNLINITKINNFLKLKLKLEFHKNKIEVNLIEYGFDFVGYIHREYSVYTRKRNINNLISKLKNNNINSINSYFGLFKYTNSYNTRIKLRNIFLKFGWYLNNKLTKSIFKFSFSSSLSFT